MNTDTTGFHTCKECPKTESLWKMTTRKENNWKTEEALTRAGVTVVTERIKGSSPWCLWWWFLKIIFEEYRGGYERDGSQHRSALHKATCSVPLPFFSPNCTTQIFEFLTNIRRKKLNFFENWTNLIITVYEDVCRPALLDVIAETNCVLWQVRAETEKKIWRCEHKYGARLNQTFEQTTISSWYKTNFVQNDTELKWYFLRLALLTYLLIYSMVQGFVAKKTDT